AATAHVQAATDTLTIGTMQVTGDPVLVNSGNVDLAGIPSVSGNPYVIVAGGNISSSSTVSLNTGSSGNGGNVVLVAGATAVDDGTNTTISGRSGNGGIIDLTTHPLSAFDTSTSCCPGGNGGNVSLIAFADHAGGTSGGTVSVTANNGIR